MIPLLLVLIFIRPFISSLAFPSADLVYSEILIGFLIFWLFSKSPGLKKTLAAKYPLILFCCALIISTLFSQNKLNSLKEFPKYISCILAFLFSVSLTAENKKQVTKTIIFAGLIISFLAIYQYFFGFQRILTYIIKKEVASPFIMDCVGRKRVFFPFVTPNALGGYLAMLIPLSLIHNNKTLFLIPLSFALLLTGSLGASLSLFLGSFLYIYLKNGWLKKNGVFLIAIAAILTTVFALRQITTKEHFLPGFSIVKRLDYWQDTWKIIKVHPFLGIGIGNFNLPLSRYSHNSYLQIWAEMGIIGIISFLWLIISAFKFGLKNLNVSSDKTLIISLITANFIFLAHNLVDFTFFLPEISLIWWVILGISCFSTSGRQIDYKIPCHS